MNDNENKINDIKSDNKSLFDGIQKIFSDFFSEIYKFLYDNEFDDNSSNNGSNNTEK